jgi:hypothetical protein
MLLCFRIVCALLMLSSVVSTSKRLFSSMSAGKTLHSFQAAKLNGDVLDLSVFQGKPVLIENIASL